MNIKKIEQYSFIKNEVEHLETKIEKMQFQDDEFVADTVSGSSVNFPYIQKKYLVTGLDDEKYIKIDNLRSELFKRKTELNEIETFIYNIDDAEMRLILSLRCIDNMKWEDIAAKMVVLDDGGNILKNINRTTLMRKYKTFLKKDAQNAQNARIAHSKGV